MATIQSFEDLEIWKKAQEYAVTIYRMAESNEKIKRDFSFKDQLKRAALSVSNNIAEGFEYNNNNDFYRYLRIAKGSCGEVKNCLIFSKNVCYTTAGEINALIENMSLLGKQIGKLMVYIHQKRVTNRKTGTTRNPQPVTRNFL